MSGGMDHARFKPTEVLLWQGTNPKARDFRVDSIGKLPISCARSSQAVNTRLVRAYRQNVSFPYSWEFHDQRCGKR